MTTTNNNIEVHNESEFILFLRHNEIKLTPEIRLLYYMSSMNICFVCHHIDSYIKSWNHFESYPELKAHFIDKHTKDYSGNYTQKGSAYGLSRSDMYDHYSKTEIIAWNNNKILGLIDQMIVLENYLDRRINQRKRDPDKRLIFYKDLGSTIVKIMKEYQIPLKIFTKYLGIAGHLLEKYTTTYYMSLDDKDKPGWMRAFY